MASIDKVVSKGIAGTSLWSSRHCKGVVAATLALTLVMGYGVTLITTNVDVADVLPRGDPNTEAAKNLTTKFKSTFTQQVTFQIHVADGDNIKYWEADNAKLTYRLSGYGDNANSVATPPAASSPQANSQHITDEVYIRAMWELSKFIKAETDFSRSISHAGIYALINWTIAGGEGVALDSAYDLPTYKDPAGAQRFQLVDSTTKAAVLDSLDAISSPSWNHGAMLFTPSADEETDMRTLGDQIIAARDEYLKAVEDGETEFTVFGPWNPPLFTVDLPVANAHSSALVEEDMVKLMPLVAAFIIVCLFIAFRNGRSIAISFTALGVGVIWTYGTMGYLGIALNTLNMTIVPLIMGVGIDYAIHMINEFLEHKAEGHTDAQAFAIAGERAGLAMFIATLTTVLGLVVMIISPSLLMAQMGFLSAIAIASIYVITLTFIPAALTLLGGTDKMGGSFTPSKAMPAISRAVTRIWPVVLLLVAGLTVAAYFGAQALEEEAFGDPGKNFPPEDKLRKEHEQGLSYFYEVEDPSIKTNILTFEGPNILTPDAIEYMAEIEKNLMQKPRVISDTLRTLMFFVDTYQTVKGGPECVAPYLASESTPGTLDPILGAVTQSGACDLRDTYQLAVDGDLQSVIEDVFNSPMRDLASIIINYPDLDMAAMTFGVDASSYDDAEEAWNQVWAAIDSANNKFDGSPPEGVYVAFVGNTATNYLFVAKELPWLTYMSIAATIILFILVLVFTRDLKATIIATFLAGITSLWWLAILPFINIGLAITLMLPLVFIFNIGTDYVVHIMWNIKQVGDPREVFATVGKAILFSAITTAGAFAFFILIQNVAVSRTMFATTLSIFVIFIATMMVIPAFYHVQAKGEKPGQKRKRRRKAKPALAPKTYTAAKRPKA